MKTAKTLVNVLDSDLFIKYTDEKQIELHQQSGLIIIITAKEAANLATALNKAVNILQS